MALVVDRNIVNMVAHATTMGAKLIVDDGWASQMPKLDLNFSNASNRLINWF